MSATERDTKMALLKEEYFFPNKRIGEFDQHIITIKAWSVTFSMAAIGTAFAQKLPVLLLLASLASLLFCIIEAFWKSFQQAFYPRLRVIEEYFTSRVTVEIDPVRSKNSNG